MIFILDDCAVFCLVQETIVVRTAAAKRKINDFFMSTLSCLKLSKHIFAQEKIMFNSVFSSIYMTIEMENCGLLLKYQI